MNGDYNGLINFFITTLIISSKDLSKDLKDIDFTGCTLSTLILFFNEVFKQFSTVQSFDDCDNLISPFVKYCSALSPEEYVILINYIMVIEHECQNETLVDILEVIIERSLDLLIRKYKVTPVGLSFVFVFVLNLSNLSNLSNLLNLSNLSNLSNLPNLSNLSNLSNLLIRESLTYRSFFACLQTHCN